MTFGHLIGNLPIKEYLEKIVEAGRVGQAFLFAGPAGVGKRQFAHAFAKLLVCEGDAACSAKVESGNHPDIHVYRPAGKVSMHSIDALRSLSAEVALPPNEAPRKVFILEEAERMPPTSANALLKTFEEPTPNTVIVLVTDHPSLLLTTILSRCRQLNFHALPEEKIRDYLMNRGVDGDQADHCAMLAHGSLGAALDLLQKGEDPIRKTTLDLMAQGHLRRYGDLRSLVADISKRIEAKMDELRSEAEELRIKRVKDQLSAAQQEDIRKEIDGAVSGYQQREVSRLLADIHGWYRDLLLVRLGGDRNLLIHRDYEPQLEHAVKAKRPMPTLDYLEKAIKDCQTSLRRSTSLPICLETLFLKLGY